MAGDLGPSITDTLKDFEARLKSFETRDVTLITRGTVTAYDAATHTATVTVRGESFTGIPIDYGIGAWAVRAGVNVGATAGVLGFSSSVPSNGCIVYITSSTPPPDQFSPITGHRHRGLVDDGPTL